MITMYCNLKIKSYLPASIKTRYAGVFWALFEPDLSCIAMLQSFFEKICVNASCEVSTVSAMSIGIATKRLVME